MAFPLDLRMLRGRKTARNQREGLSTIFLNFCLLVIITFLVLSHWWPSIWQWFGTSDLMTIHYVKTCQHWRPIEPAWNFYPLIGQWYSRSWQKQYFQRPTFSTDVQKLYHEMTINSYFKNGTYRLFFSHSRRKNFLKLVLCFCCSILRSHSWL